jgi:hypothetical protein
MQMFPILEGVGGVVSVCNADRWHGCGCVVRSLRAPIKLFIGTRNLIVRLKLKQQSIPWIMGFSARKIFPAAFSIIWGLLSSSFFLH